MQIHRGKRNEQSRMKKKNEKRKTENGTESKGGRRIERSARWGWDGMRWINGIFYSIGPSPRLQT